MKTILVSLLKYVSLPLALLYGLIIALRNKLYDSGFFTSIEFSVPVICVGNITVGGTGKSPHIEYLVELLSPTYSVATLSRGYKRYTRGFRIADENSNARDIGDEPFQFKHKFPALTVCVAEERMTAIPQLLQQRQHVQAILLDDAFQHRTVRAGMNILLTDYERLYTRDHIMPFGLLRESPKAAERAQIIIVTKCPAHLSLEQKQQLQNEIAPLPSQQLYFTCIRYTTLYPLTHQSKAIPKQCEILLVCGIANPKPLETHLQSTGNRVHALLYKDHHYFTQDDIEEIKEAFMHMPGESKIIVCTEKDAARLYLHKERIEALALPIWIQPIGIDFLFDEGDAFNQQIRDFVGSMIPTDPADEELMYEEIVAM